MIPTETGARPGTGLTPVDTPPTGCEALTAKGQIVRIRPVTRADADALRALNSRVTDRSLYFRFFALNRNVADDYVESVVRPTDRDHAALVALLGGVVVAVAGFERTGDDEAEVALLVEDAHQGEGVGTLLLEHLAAAARSVGVRELVGDVLVDNRRMAAVFADSGLRSRSSLADGVSRFRLATTADEETLLAMDTREERAELASLHPLLEPRTVAVVGASRRPGSVGHEVLSSIVAGHFAGSVYPVNPRARQVAGLTAYPTVSEIPGQVDLAVVSVPVAALED
ncbi:MAG: GNAT family N-acetyltransferase, partial [Actinomycetes bacterium]